MQHRILSQTGVLRMNQSILIDRLGLWSRFGCEEMAKSEGYEIIHFSDDMKLRHFYEAECQERTDTKRVIVIDNSSLYIPFDIKRRFPVIILDYRLIFPSLSEEALIGLPGLDYDHLAFIAGNTILPKMDKGSTLRFCARAHSQNQNFFAVGEERSRQRVIVIHAREPAALDLERLHAEQNIRRENNFVGRLFDLQVVVNRFALVQKIFLPKGKTVRAADDAAQNKNHHGRRTKNFPRADTHEVNHADKQQDAGEDKKSYGGAHGGNRHEGRQESSDYASDRVEGVEVADDSSVVFQVVRRVLHQRGRHGSQQEQWQDENRHARQERRPN